MTTLLYNVAIVVIDLLTFWIVWRPAWDARRPPFFSALASAVGLLSVMGLIVAVGLGENPFGMMRLACWGLFVHGPAWAVMTSLVIWRRSRRWAIAGLLASAALIAVAVDAFFIEPTWLELTHVEVSSAKITKPLKIVVIADFQTDRIGEYEQRVLDKVHELRPDLILWAGDYLQQHDPRRWEALRDAMREELRRVDLQPRLGSYAVGGNVDDPRWPEIFADLPVEVFERDGRVETGDFVVTGLAMRHSFRTDVVVGAEKRFHVVLGHCPNFALGDVDADLLVAGHVHGGQVRLPGIGPLITNSRLSRRWAAGVTQLDGDRTLVVSRGIGMERGYAPRLRFLCRPELTVIHVVPRHDSPR